MIAHSNITIRGGNLGNQFFKVAALVSLSKSKGYEIGFLQNNYPETLLHFFDINYDIKNSINQKFEYNWEQKHSLVYEDSFFDIKDNTLIDGYFQTAKYHRIDVKSLFSFKKQFKELYRKYVNVYYNSIVIHIRKNDFKECKYFDILTSEYYHKCFSRLDETKHKVIVTDDKHWVINNIEPPKNCSIFDKNSPVEAFMVLMAGETKVLANSSFGWWAYALGTQGTTYAPFNWFEGYDKTNSDVHLNDWIIV